MNLSEHVIIGELYREHGVKAYAKVYCYEGYAASLKKNCKLVLMGADGKQKKTQVVDVQLHGRFFLVKFAGISTREAVLPWRKARLCLAKKDLLKSSDEILDHEWEGFTVCDANASQVGVITSVIYNPLKQFLIEKDGNEYFVPCVADWILNVDHQAKTVTMDLPDGLF